jgi:hypothetical protein
VTHKAQHRESMLSGLYLRKFANLPAAMVLFLAALLKLIAFSRGNVSGWNWDLTQAGTVGLVSLEISIAFWLVSELNKVWIRRIALVLFAVFAVVSLAKWIMGEADCGCFGIVQTPPWASLIVNLVCLLLLGIWRVDADAQPKPEQPADSWQFALCVGLSLLAVVWTAGLTSAARLDDDPSAFGRRVFLDPQDWIDQPLPILHQVYDGRSMEQGEWTLLFYRDDCPKCHDLIDELKNGQFKPADNIQIALIKVPPANPQKSVKKFGNWVWTSMNQQVDWLMGAPTVIRMVDGKVHQVQKNW